MKKILISLSVIAVVGAVVVGGTLAYFSSTATSTQNTFSTGTINLQLSDDNEPASASITASFGGTGLLPGSVIPEQVLQVINSGNVAGNHLDLEVTLTGDVGLAQYIVYSDHNDGLRFGGPSKAGTDTVKLSVPGWTAGDAEYRIRNGLDGNQIKGPSANTGDDPELLTGTGNGMDRDLDGKVTLADLAVGKIRISPRNVNVGIAAGTTANLWANAKVDTAMGNDMQGKSVVATFTWTLDQDASQF